MQDLTVMLSSKEIQKMKSWQMLESMLADMTPELKEKIRGFIYNS
jgi:hypothetical protein